MGYNSDIPQDPCLLAVAYYYGRREENPKAKIGDRLICWWPRSRGRFSHAELVIGYDPTQQHQLCASASGRDHGVRQKAIDLSTGRWRIKPIKNATEQQYRAAQKWFWAHNGMPYDYLGIAGYVLPGRLQSDSAAFCSESVLLAMGIKNTRKSPSELERWHDQIFAEVTQ